MTKYCLKTTTNKTDTNLHSAANLMKSLTFTSPADRFARDLIGIQTADDYIEGWSRVRRRRRVIKEFIRFVLKNSG